MKDPLAHIGRREVRLDHSDRDRVDRLAALLDHRSPPWPPYALPPFGHWLYFLPGERQSEIGADGHPVRTDDGLLPNVDLPRRMWAGSRIRYLLDVPLDAPIEKVSTVLAATPKAGRSGNMLFVTVRHEISLGGGILALIEEQDIVYREAQPPGVAFARSPQDPGPEDPVARSVTADPVLLFRYSALTYNGHRIHYDRDYAQNEEGYPDLVVQGPLIATLLLDHGLRNADGRRVQSFQFRAASPLFAGEKAVLGLSLEGDSMHLRAIGPVGVVMTAQAELGA